MRRPKGISNNNFFIVFFFGYHHSGIYLFVLPIFVQIIDPLGSHMDTATGCENMRVNWSVQKEFTLFCK